MAALSKSEMKIIKIKAAIATGFLSKDIKKLPIRNVQMMADQVNSKFMTKKYKPL